MVFGAAGAVLTCVYLFDVKAHLTFRGVYPFWLLGWNGLFIVTSIFNYYTEVILTNRWTRVNSIYLIFSCTFIQFIPGIKKLKAQNRLCKECKEEDFLTEEYAEEFGLPKGAVIYQEKGCKACNYTGYSGRQAIGEFFILDDNFRSMLKERVSDHVLRERAIEQGMIPLSSQLKDLLLDGTTSIHEIIRVGVKDA